MVFGKASLILYFLFFLHFQQHFLSVRSRTVRLASDDPNHENLPAQAVVSESNGDGFAGKRREIAVVVKKGGRGGGGGGGGGRGGFFRGRGGGSSRGRDRTPYAGGGGGVIPVYAAGSRRGRHGSSGGGRRLRPAGGFLGYFGLAVLAGLVFSGCV